MGAGQIENCLQALHTSIALAKQYQQTDSPLVRSTTHLLPLMLAVHMPYASFV